MLRLSLPNSVLLLILCLEKINEILLNIPFLAATKKLVKVTMRDNTSLTAQS
jgi:hypothetical protein